MADDQDEHERRQELHEADDPEIERASRERIDLPADSDGEHLVGDDRRDASEPQEDERPMGENGIAGAHL
jgi:hypothetical protein